MIEIIRHGCREKARGWNCKIIFKQWATIKCQVPPIADLHGLHGVDSGGWVTRALTYVMEFISLYSLFFHVTLLMYWLFENSIWIDTKVFLSDRTIWYTWWTIASAVITYCYWLSNKTNLNVYLAYLSMLFLSNYHIWHCNNVYVYPRLRQWLKPIDSLIWSHCMGNHVASSLSCVCCIKR